jgi:hypothetical protein
LAPFKNITILQLEGTAIGKLSDRRAAAIEKFAKKCLSGQYSHWFPPNRGLCRTRRPKKYHEEYARCERLKNTPIYHKRRLLNSLED